jgi:hypothetical protein
VYKQILAIAALLSVVALCGCLGSSLNSNPPDYIKQVSAVKEGDGYQVYFILADVNGKETTADGKAKMNITNSRGSYFSLKADVAKSDFQKVKIGMGALEHEGLIYNVGRIPFEKLDKYNIREGTGKVIITFTTPDNRTLTGEETIFFGI